MASTLQAEPQLMASQADAKSSDLQIEIKDLIAEINNPISTIRSEWQELFDRDLSATIFQHPGYAICELGHLPKSKLPCLMLLARREGRLVGFGALVPKASSSTHVGGIGPNLKIHGYRLVGNGFLGSSDSLVEHELLEAAMREVRQRGAKFLLIEDIDQASPLLEKSQALLKRGFQIYSPTSMQIRLKINMPPTYTDYMGKFSGKTRSTFRRQEKRLGEYRIVYSTSVEHVADFLRDANQISVNTWQTDQFGLRVKNDEFELTQFTFLADQGALRSYLLYMGDIPVTFVVGMQYRGAFRYDEVGFDRRYHAVAPGKILLIKIMEDLYARDTPKWFDFGMGDADYKRVFANHESTAGNVWILPPGIRSKCLVGFLNGSRKVRQMGRSMTQVLGWYTRMRQKSRLGASVDVTAKETLAQAAGADEAEPVAVKTEKPNKGGEKKKKAAAPQNPKGEGQDTPSVP
jgi:CelD/BcsL family acetyltransferase involved in cellulose biosynthesis